MQKAYIQISGDKVFRFDRNGQPIMRNPKHLGIGKGKVTSPELKDSGLSPSKKDKDKTKFKVTFIDKVEKEASLTTTHYVLSYKKYNAMNTFDPFEDNGD